jgi:tripartite-type tricarboxylate transporter receptor subunit TctC
MNPREIIAKAALAAALVCAGLSALPTIAVAQDYPSKAVELIVPYSPGGSADLTARILADGLTRQLNQPMLVVNKPGASSIVGSQFVANAKPDGYVLLVNGTAQTVVANKPDLPYDGSAAFIPITRFASTPYLLVVNPEKLPVKNVQELITLLKASPPGSFNYASAGVGASAHLAGELFKSTAGVDITHVPFPGGSGPGVQATIAGQVQLTFATPASQTLQAIEAGQLRVLGVSSAPRWEGMPDVPTVAEQGFPGFEVEFWNAVFAPKGTPQPVIDRIYQAIVKASEDPELSKKLKGMYYTQPLQTPEEFRVFIDEDIKKWGAIIKAANIPL